MEHNDNEQLNYGNWSNNHSQADDTLITSVLYFLNVTVQWYHILAVMVVLVAGSLYLAFGVNGEQITGASLALCAGCQ